MHRTSQEMHRTSQEMHRTLQEMHRTVLIATGITNWHRVLHVF